MRTETVTQRIGENVGPVDWSHPLAKDMPDAWREAERNPDGFLFDYGHGVREIIEICMYDGWPYWKPTPAVCYIGPLRSGEWAFFNSYGVWPSSIVPRKRTSGFAQDRNGLEPQGAGPVGSGADDAP